MNIRKLDQTDTTCSQDHFLGIAELYIKILIFVNNATRFDGVRVA